LPAIQLFLAYWCRPLKSKHHLPAQLHFPPHHLRIHTHPDRLIHAMDDPTLSSSGLTIPSDSENYDANNESSPSSSPPSSSSTPLILYKPPTLWGLVRGAAINLLLPFVNGLMLGFGELVANEVAFRLGWSGTKVSFSFASRSDGDRGRRCCCGFGGHMSFWKRHVVLTICPDLPYKPRRIKTSRSRRRNARRSCGATEAEWTRVGHVHVFGVGRVKGWT